MNESEDIKELEKLEDPNENQEAKEPVQFEAPKILSRPDEKKPHEKKSAEEQGEKAKSSSDNEKDSPFKKVVAVQFHAAGKIYDFECGKKELRSGDHVIVETDEGLGFATVVIGPREEAISGSARPLKKVIRQTNYEDMRQHQKNKERESRAYQVCKDKIKQFKLPMKLVSAEYLHSGSKAIFYFTSEGRVDFRNLVRDLAHEFHTRIEIRQIGPRDETKMMGGIGVCGRELCCTTWLRDFDPISIKMAKEQELSLNPSKLAGQCGRLKCCLAYEYETYQVAKKGLPKLGRKVCWKNGDPCGRIAGHNIFNGTIRVALEDGTEKVVMPDEIQFTDQIKPESAATNIPEPSNPIDSPESNGE